MALFGDDLAAVRALLTASTVVPFALFASAGIWHFGSGAKAGTNLVSIASLASFVAVVVSIWSHEPSVAAVLGVVFQCLSAFLFGWSVGTSGRRTLSLAFGDSRSTRLLTEGPYAVVRHPFYTSYLLFWIGGVLVAPTVWTAVSLVVMIVIYRQASRREDEGLARHFPAEFPQWRSKTGAFFPKWR